MVFEHALRIRMKEERSPSEVVSTPAPTVSEVAISIIDTTASDAPEVVTSDSTSENPVPADMEDEAIVVATSSGSAPQTEAGNTPKSGEKDMKDGLEPVVGYVHCRSRLLRRNI